MLPNELRSLLEDKFSLCRSRIRYNGTGPRLHDDGSTNKKIWPRDSVDSEDVSRKILFSLRDSNISPASEAKINEIIKYIFDGLRRCNVSNLFNKYCPMEFGKYDRVPFEINYVLDAYTTYNQILSFIHSVIKSIDGLNKHKSHRESYIKFIFGSNANFDIFKKNLRWLIISSANISDVTIDSFLSCGAKFMDLDQIDWLKDLEPKVKYQAFIQVVFALLRFIIELLSRYFYITQSNPYFAKLFYFRYDLWQKISHTATRRLMQSSILVELRLDNDVIDSLKPIAISKLKYHLKKDYVRPICTSKTKDLRANHFGEKFRAILKHVRVRMANYRTFSLNNLLEGLRHFKERHNRGDGIYFVRADIKDCFSSVKQTLLRKIIKDYLSPEAENRAKVTLFKVVCTRIKDNKSIIQYCTDLEEFQQNNARHFSIDNYDDESLSLEEFDADFLRPCIEEPVLRETRNSRKGYILRQGLRQGSSFSPVLSSIYIQHAFNKELGEFLNSINCRIYRYVDDILFMSTDLKLSEKFMHKMLRGFKEYNLTMNLDKVACNFICRGLDPRLCRSPDCVIFYRKRICLKSLQCSYHFNHESLQLLYSFKIDPHMSRTGIMRAIKSHRWEFIHLDKTLNSIDAVMTNIFERSLLVAHRAATMITFSFFFCNYQDEQLVIDIVNITILRVWSAIIRGSKLNVINNGLSHQQVKIIVAAAFEVTWNLKKLCNRAIERNRLKKFRNRANMRYLTYTQGGQDSNLSITKPLDFESQVQKLINEFPTSALAKEILIPDKGAAF